MKRMRIAASAVMLLVLVGCSSDEDNLTPRDKAYVKTLREEITGVKDMSDGKLVAIGHEACASADKASNIEQVVENISRYDLTPSDSAYVAGAALAAYCSENLELLPGG
jgi:uncharacterized protein YcfL